MLTPKKDLRFGEPLWTSYRTPKAPFETLERDIKTDVIVIGAGISGALVAEELSDAGLKVVVLDRRGPGKGSTMATTALLQYEIDQPLVKLIRQVGFDKASRAWRRSKLSVESLAARTRILGIDCDMERINSVYLSGDTLNIVQLKKEQNLRNQIGLQTGFVSRADLAKAGILSPGALESFDNFFANPYKICTGYLNKAVERGAKIYAPVNAVHVDNHARGLTVHTEGGFKIKARHAVFATGYEAPKQLRHRDFQIASTWAFATVKQGKDVLMPEMPLIWEASEPYLYIRTTSDGRIICGGEDEKFVSEDERNALSPAKVKKLQSKLKKLMPKVNTKAEFAWSGSFGVTKTGLPMIGALPDMPNCYAILAFGGNGITFSRIGAEIIRGAITGMNDPDEGLFGFK